MNRPVTPLLDRALSKRYRYPRAAYQTVQGWQQQECRKLPDAAERQRCLNSTAASYDDYRRQREAAQGPK
jgi:hypothetical protein